MKGISQLSLYHIGLELYIYLGDSKISYLGGKDMIICHDNFCK